MADLTLFSRFVGLDLATAPAAILGCSLSLCRFAGFDPTGPFLPITLRSNHGRSGVQVCPFSRSTAGPIGRLAFKPDISAQSTGPKRGQTGGCMRKEPPPLVVNPVVRAAVWLQNVLTGFTPIGLHAERRLSS